MKKQKIALISILVLMQGLISCNDKDPNSLTIAEVTHSVFYAPQYVAKNCGYFAEEGLTVDFITTPGADKTMAALLSKDADIGLMGPEASIYIERNKAEDYVINFSKLTQRDGSFLLGREKDDEFTYSKLKGKTIIGGRKGGMPEMVLEYVLKNAGLDVKRDDENAEVNVRTDVQFDVMAGVFTSGQSDYVALFEPSATQVENNSIGHIVASLGQDSGQVPYTAYSALSSTISDKAEVIKKFNRAIKKGIDFVYTNDSTTVAEKLAPDFLSSPQAELVKIVDNYKGIKAYAEDQKISREEFEKLVEIVRMAGEIDADEVPPFAKLVTDQYID